MEKHLGRPLAGDEDVHHIDFDKLNNDISNLMLLKRCEHAQLHHLLKGHQVYSNEIRTQDGIINVLRSATRRKCIDCGTDLSVGENSKSCVVRCVKCSRLHSRKVIRPTKEQLEKEVLEHAYLVLEDKYGVSTAAIKKWMRQYDIPIPNRRRNWIRDKEYVVTDNMIAARSAISSKLKEYYKDGTPSDKPIVQYTMTGEFVAEYRSGAEAARRNESFNDSPIIRVCKGKAKSYKGFVWKYK